MGEPEFLHNFEQARRLHGAMWAAGDYTRVAEQLTGVSAAVVEAAGIVSGIPTGRDASGGELDG